MLLVVQELLENEDPLVKEERLGIKVYQVLLDRPVRLDNWD